MTHPNNGITDYEYDNLGRLVSVTDPENRETQYEYDPVGRLKKVIDGNQDDEQRWTYTQDGRADTVIDGNNNTTSNAYDDYGRLVKTIYPDASYEELTLDDADRTTAVLTRGGQTINLVYDDLDRMISRTIPGSGTDTFTYDLAGRVLDAVGPNGTIVHAYDTAGRLSSITYPGSRVVSYEYDAASNRTKLTYPDSTYITYAYDELNRLTAILDSGANPLASYTYDDLSRLVNLAYTNGTATEYTYNSLDRITDLTHKYWTGGDVPLSYTYDNSGLQTGFTVNDTRFEPLFMVDDQVTTSVNQLNQYTTFGAKTLTYTPAGNLLSDGTRTFTYDAANRLISETSSGVSFSYDPLDRRASKSISGGSMNYIYDGDEVIAEFDGTGQLVRKYVLGAGIDNPVLMETNGQTYYFHADSLGSTITLTNAAKNVAETYQYTVYGQPNQVSTIGNPYLFTGRRWDNETGLYYYRARYYDAGLRRFLQPDPIGYLGGMNLYAYVNNDPVNSIDPYGLSAMEIAVPLAFCCAMIDSPVLPFGDILGGAIIGVAWLWDNYPDEIPTSMAASNDDEIVEEILKGKKGSIK